MAFGSISLLKVDINDLNLFALVTPPASGETIAISLSGSNNCGYLSLNSSKTTTKDSKLSTGVWGLKNPWICPECKSIHTTLFTPITSNIIATSAAEMVVPFCVFLSALAYP